jgi:2-dehydropantoate 2-reductase
VPAGNPQRICIYGAGAVGGNFAVRLAAAGHTVSVVARGDHLAAIGSNGLTLHSGDSTTTVQVAASDDPAALGEQDLVIATLKAHALPAMAERIGPLLGPGTPVIFAQNGIPWWYAHGLAPSRPRPPARGLLNESGLAAAIGVERVIGGVIHSSNDVARPGVIRNNSPKRNRLAIGEVDDAATPRIARLRALLEEATIESPPTGDLRALIWDKLISNMRVSLLSFLVERTSREVYDDPEIRPIIDRLGAEGVAIAAAHGVACTIDAGGPSPGHRSSMLQDYEQGRAQEIDALVTAPQLFSRAMHVDTPTFDTIAGLVRAKAATAPAR